MTKQELAVAISDRLNIPRNQASVVINEILDEITHRLHHGERVTLAGFGVFEAVERAPRKAHNPRTGEPVEVPAKTVPKFTASKQLKDAVAE